VGTAGQRTTWIKAVLQETHKIYDLDKVGQQELENLDKVYIGTKDYLEKVGTAGQQKTSTKWVQYDNRQH
jgi:hypothetical protein